MAVSSAAGHAKMTEMNYVIALVDCFEKKNNILINNILKFMADKKKRRRNRLGVKYAGPKLYNVNYECWYTKLWKSNESSEFQEF